MKSLFLFLSILTLFLLIPFAQAHTITVPAWYYFPTQGYWINFSPSQVLGTWSYDAVNDYQYFDGYGFQVQNANMTITNFFSNNKLEFTNTAGTGNISTTEVYVGSKGKPTAVEINNQAYSEGDKWTWDSLGSIVTVTWIHSSVANIILSWVSSSSDEQEPDGEPYTDTTQIIRVTPEDKSGLLWFAAFVLVLIVAVGLTETKRHTKSLRKLWEKTW